MIFKSLENNSVIKEIGSIFRLHESSDWHINVNLTPNQKKQCFSFSQVPILARRRVLNATEASQPAGYKMSTTIENTHLWSHKLIEDCPISAVNRQEDAQQWCFVFESGGTQYFLPQLELARVLFLNNAYIARLSMCQNGLIQEFDVQRFNESNEAQINILPTSSMPLKSRGDDALRQRLAWILLDMDARRSFESIARYQLQNGYDNDLYRLWKFQFDPPPLAGVELTLRGHYEPELKACYVYEIYSISKLNSTCPSNVDIVDPRYAESRLGQGYNRQTGSPLASDLIIDDEQDPDINLAEIGIDAPIVRFEFANPFETTRLSTGRTQSGGCRKEEDPTRPSENSCVKVSTGESSILGTMPPADYSAVKVASDNIDIYTVTDTFKAFDAMVEQLTNMPNCTHIHREIHKLPAIFGYSKHLLINGQPRYLAWHIIKKDGDVYALIEVDNTDNRSSLATLLLKQKHSKFDWDKYIRELGSNLIKLSLVWPTSRLNQTFGSNYKRISHPSSPSKMVALSQESIQMWAKRALISADLLRNNR
ncbi:MAG: Tn7-like element transposition protein TnsE [Atribacterota bacterium]|jgi:hypothetical protein|nr:Tn7-like element transposition protein TnsE [Atribacterota bacterium]MDY0414795.1 Tn7-like element transposition protein TnsE [Pseudomonas sp.]